MSRKKIMEINTKYSMMEKLRKRDDTYPYDKFVKDLVLLLLESALLNSVFFKQLYIQLGVLGVLKPKYKKTYKRKNTAYLNIIQRIFRPLIEITIKTLFSYLSPPP